MSQYPAPTPGGYPPVAPNHQQAVTILVLVVSLVSLALWLVVAGTMVTTTTFGP